MKKILIVHPYPTDTAPSQRFRFEQYFDYLDHNNIAYDLRPFMDPKTWKILYKSGNTFRKVWGILLGFFKRWLLLFKVSKYDYVFVHREATPLGPPWWEWIVTKVFKKKLIFDFDDAIWLPNTSKQNRIVGWLKFHQKTALICGWAYKVSAGNQYLCDYASQYCDQVIHNPTTIDTESMHNPDLFPKETNTKLTIGWTGTHSTIKYLDDFVPILKSLEHKYDFDFLVISNQEPTFELESLKFVYWNKDTEMQDLLKIDIGIMPLTDDKWAKGKCGFKALQYMALAKPALVSPVGVNTNIVQDGINGYVCDTKEEWTNALEKLLSNTNLHHEIGLKARQRIIDRYSVLSNQKSFVDLFT